MDANEICQFCKEIIDYKLRVPLVMNCSHVICHMCRENFSTIEKSTPGKSDETFNCPTCNTEQQMKTDALNKNLDLWKKQQAHSGHQQIKHPFTCHIHERKIIFFSQERQQFLCSYCVLEQEITTETAFICQEDDIAAHAKLLVDQLKAVQKKIEEQIDSMAQISTKEEQLNSSELLLKFTSCYRQIRRFFKVNASEKTLFKFGTQKQELSISKIISDSEIFCQLKKLVPQYKQIELIYDGQKDGLTPKKFHQKCDNKGPTISVIKSQDDDVFGLYTDIPWDTDGDCQTQFGNSFAFKVSADGTITKLNTKQGSDYETYHSKSNFCSNGAFYCTIEKNKQVGAINPLGKYFELPDMIDNQNSDLAKYFLTNGKKEFKIAIIEVFKLK